MGGHNMLGTEGYGQLRSTLRGFADRPLGGLGVRVQRAALLAGTALDRRVKHNKTDSDGQSARDAMPLK